MDLNVNGGKFDLIDPDINHYYQDHDPRDVCNSYTIDNFPNIDENQTDSLSVVNFNIRSYFKNFEEFQIVLDTTKFKHDIIILTETWARSNTSQLCTIPGYNAYHCYRPSRNGGGVSIFIKENLISEPMNLNISTNIIECLGVKVKGIDNNWVKILGVYRPQSGLITDFNEKLESILNEFSFCNNSSILAGDFNICILNEMSNNYSDDLFNMLQSKYFRPLILEPTRVSSNKASLLDHIWTNISNKTYSVILKVDVTDHYPVFSYINFFKSKENELIKIRFRDFSSVNVANFKEELQCIDWNICFCEANDPNVITPIFLNKIDQIYNKCFPIKIKRIGKKDYVVHG